MSKVFSKVIFAFLFITVTGVEAVNHVPPYAEFLLRNDFTFDQDQFQGDWKDSLRWDGWVCNGYYHYDVSMRGKIERINIKLGQKGHLEIWGDLDFIYGSIDGTYLSKATLCLPVRADLGVTLRRGRVGVDVEFLERYGDEIPKFNLRVLHTSFGTMEFENWDLPNWMERFLAKKASDAFSRIWKSNLGKWLSEKISEEIKKQP